MTTPARPGARGAPGGSYDRSPVSLVRRHLITPLADGRTLRHLGLLVSAIPLGTAWFVLLVTGWSLGLGLLITLLGVPVLLGLAFAVRECARLERGLLDVVAGTRLAGPRRPIWSGSVLGALGHQAIDPRAWRDQAYLLLRFVLGLPFALVALGLIGAGLQIAFAPTYYYAADGIDVGVWRVDTLPEALLVVPVGLALLVLAIPVTDGLGRLWTAIATAVLGPSSADPVPSPAPVRRLAPTRAQTILGVLVTLVAVATVCLVCVVIWVATTPGGYFWPVWLIMPLFSIVAIVAISALAPVVAPDASVRVRVLLRHAGISAVLALFLVGVWLVTTPGGYFWPIWPILVLALLLGVHAAWVALGSGAHRQMADRIDVLTSTRAQAADAQAAELRRIERDLHDGAQARLVSLAMDLGMARERMDTDPDDARARVAEAHDEAKRALVELRDLARGIHPAVLTDRGLAAALGSLAATNAIPTDVDVSVDGRLEPAIEAAAYFTVSEALANAAKHSGATAVSVRVAREGDVLRVRVSDDGGGGADEAGGGLAGLRRRLAAHDGTLAVSSPPAGGTVLEAELPCGS